MLRDELGTLLQALHSCYALTVHALHGTCMLHTLHTLCTHYAHTARAMHTCIVHTTTLHTGCVQQLCACSGAHRGCTLAALCLLGLSLCL